MAKSTQEKTDYKRKYNEENYARIGLYLPPKEKEAWQAAANAEGVKHLSEFVKMCVNEKISKAVE